MRRALVVALLSFSQCLFSQTREVEISLAGKWKLLVGEQAIGTEVLSPDFDDSDWQSVNAPEAWDKQKGFEGFAGFGVYRKSVVIPAAARERTLTLALGRIGSADETYFNGVLIGRTGEATVGRDLETRLYVVPDSLIRYGKKNVIAVRVFCREANGGIYEGVGKDKSAIGVYSKTALRKLLEKPAKLAGESVAAEIQKVVAAMDRALFAGKLDVYNLFLSEAYFNDGTPYGEHQLFLRSLLPNVQGASAEYRDFVVYERAENRFVADYETRLYKDGKLFAIAYDERHFAKVKGEWKEIGNQSRFFEIIARSRFMNADVKTLVYLPPSYLRKSGRRYPSLFLLAPRGASAELWRDVKLADLLDSLVLSGKMTEMIVAMPEECGSFYAESKDGKRRFESFFLKELIELVEEDYRALGEARFRGVSGVSTGGNAAFCLALKSEEGRKAFSSVSATMPVFNRRYNEPRIDGGDPSFWNDYDVANVIERLPKDALASLTFHLTIGKDDYFRPATESVVKALKAKTNRFTVAEYEGGNSFEFWTRHLVDALLFHSERFKANQAE
ncbi:MAG: esterase family protein [Chloroherpetonaceae bacterium]|nr:esterase family protein [Chloroherpetonaceae bacterium]MDW8436752.1 alpha/beta hydrolase-fold protein [Chloroherpetonaceae bacterium]